MGTSPSLFRSPAPGERPLDIGAAIGDGWQAFCRAPWPFIGFTLVVGVLNSLCSLLQGVGQGSPEEPVTLPILLLSIVGSVASIVVSLWGSTGMIRGAWQALEGRKPTFGSFIRWDGAALRRLLASWFFLLIVFLGVILATGLLSAGFSWVNQVAGLIPLLVGFGVMLYLAITQKFLSQVALLENPGMVRSFQRGREIVSPQWGRVLLLTLAEVGILLLGMLACLVGLFVAAPVATCVSTAAYRQLFGREDRTGLLAGETL